MDKKEFRKILERTLNNFGFQYKNKAYYNDNGSVITVIVLQKSNFENSYFINFGFLLKEASPSIKYPKESDCDLFGRFVLEYNGEKYQSIDLSQFTAEVLSDLISEYVNKNIKQVVEFGLNKYLELNPKAIYTMSLKAKNYLKL